MLNTKALAASASAPKVYVEDVFSTWLYDGNGSTQTITNGINLSGKGGLVWIRSRSQAVDHQLFDTARGATKELISNATAAETTDTDTLTAFNADGFSLGADATTNTSGAALVSWTFRKAAKFFDVATYTGTGSLQNIPHGLGSVPGAMIIKPTTFADNWIVWHRSLGYLKKLYLNSTSAQIASSAEFGSADPTSTTFSVGADNGTNANGQTYVAYLFAHDAGGFGDSGNDSVISCGSYTGNGSSTNGPTVSLGWETQWLLVKRTDLAENWNIVDTVRGCVVNNTDFMLNPNLANAEDPGERINLSATGFQVATTSATFNASGGTYIYIAIRRGPMKTPTDATKVFQAKLYTGTNVDNQLVTTDILTDMVWVRERNDTTPKGFGVGDRLRGQPYLWTNDNNADTTADDAFDQQLVGAVQYGTAFSSMSGFYVGNNAIAKFNIDTASNNHVALAFRRAPGYFDIVGYTGTGSARTVSHNLGVTPELMIVRRREGESWSVYAAPVGATQYGLLDSDSSFNAASTRWNDTAPTASAFTVGTSLEVNGSGSTYIAYLFATLPGISKVGSYTGTGTTKDIDCGFTNGARFVMIKRTDSGDVGDWYVYDTARGISSGNDPYLLTSATAAEVTNTDYIDPLSSGFQISSTAPAAINANGGSYIFLAIA